MTEVPKLGTQASKLRQFLAALTASLIALCAGTCLAWSSPTLPILQRGLEEPHLTLEEASWVGSLITVGAVVGCIPGGQLADFFGRKRLLLMLAGPLSASWTLLLFTKSAWGFYIGRLLAGLSIGAMSVAVPTYINDLARPEVRGTLGTLFQLQLTLGLLTMYIIGLMDTVFTMTLICSFFPLVFVCCFFWMPESPPWLISKGKLDEASKALQRFRGPHYNIQQELSDMQSNLSKGTNNASLFNVFGSPLSRKAISLTLGLMFFQQACGVNAVVFYTHKIFVLSGSMISPSISTIVLAFFIVISTVSAALLMDVAGRRILLMFSATVMGISLLVLGAFVRYRFPGLSWLPLACLVLYCISFSMGFGPVPWIMMAELFPDHLKASASAVTAASSWGLAFIVTKFFQDLVVLWGMDITFWIFSFFCFLGLFFVVFFLPETKGKTTDEILEELGALKGTSTTTPIPTTNEAAV